MMKRFAVYFCILLMLVSHVAMAENDSSAYIGNMEVVNCNEWVSLREKPSTSAARLVKVSLGAIVHSCYAFSDEWCYAQYDGYTGYILSKYLQPSEGRITFSAMLITAGDEGVPIYAVVDGTEPMDIIPANTIVRSCRIMDNGRVYVQWGCRAGFVDMNHAQPYNTMLHFPKRLTLITNPYRDEYEGPSPALMADYAEGFYLMDYDYSEYVQENASAPMAEFVLYSDQTVRNVHLFSIWMTGFDADTGETVYDAALEHIQYQVDPDHPLAVSAVIWGDTPNLAVGYEDEAGVYHFAFVEISGEDGSVLLREF